MNTSAREVTVREGEALDLFCDSTSPYQVSGATRDCELMVFVAVVLLGAQRVRISDNLAQRRRGSQVSHWSAHEKLLLHGKCQLLMRVMTHRVITANGLSVCIYLAISCFMKNLLIHFLLIRQPTLWGFEWRKSSTRCGLHIPRVSGQWAGQWKCHLANTDSVELDKIRSDTQK